MKILRTAAESSPSHAPFPETRWSRILTASREEGLEELLEIYWRPIYATLRRFHGLSPQDAEDVTQEFLMKLLERDVLSGITPEGARFRTFLKSALTNHMHDRRRTECALKRGGGRSPIALDIPSMEGVLVRDLAPSTEGAFEREWRRCVIEQASRRLQNALESEGRDGHYRVFEIVDLKGEGKVSYREAGESLGLSEESVRDHLHYARRAFRASVLEVLRDSVTTAEELDAEVQELFGG